MERGAAVRWMKGKRRVDPLSIKRQTAGRVWVDSANRFHIGLLLLSDTAVYKSVEAKTLHKTKYRSFGIAVVLGRCDWWSKDELGGCLMD